MNDRPEHLGDEPLRALRLKQNSVSARGGFEFPDPSNASPVDHRRFPHPECPGGSASRIFSTISLDGARRADAFDEQLAKARDVWLLALAELKTASRVRAFMDLFVEQTKAKG
jgi:hypothetical protein